MCLSAITATIQKEEEFVTLKKIMQFVKARHGKWKIINVCFNWLMDREGMRSEALPNAADDSQLRERLK